MAWFAYPDALENLFMYLYVIYGNIWLVLCLILNWIVSFCWAIWIFFFFFVCLNLIRLIILVSFSECSLLNICKHNMFWFHNVEFFNIAEFIIFSIFSSELSRFLKYRFMPSRNVDIFTSFPVKMAFSFFLDKEKFCIELLIQL